MRLKGTHNILYQPEQARNFIGRGVVDHYISYKNTQNYNFLKNQIEIDIKNIPAELANEVRFLYKQLIACHL